MSRFVECGSALPGARMALLHLVSSRPGLVLEDKRSALAIHYRGAPELKPIVLAEVARVTALLAPDFEPRDGNMVVEIQPAGITLASAILAFMRERPFAGRCPVVVGDAVAGQDALAQVGRLGTPLRRENSAAALKLGTALNLCAEAAARQPLRPRHQYLLGRVLVAARRYSDAAREFSAADHAGYALAAFGLAKLYASGQGVERDWRVALQLFLRAGAGGVVDALAWGGIVYATGPGPDFHVAAAWFERAAAGGSSVGRGDLGWLYEIGKGEDRNLDRATRLYIEAAADGDTESMVSLGRLTRDGRGVRRDPTAACRWFAKAARTGNPDGEGALAACYYTGIGAPKDHRTAFGWYYRAAEAGGSAGFEDMVATMYELGDGVPTSDSEAVLWYRRAAAQNEPFAMTQLAMHLHLGRGVRRSDEEARYWFRRAAAQGNVQAQVALGLGFDGDGERPAEPVRLEWRDMPHAPTPVLAHPAVAARGAMRHSPDCADAEIAASLLSRLAVSDALVA